jgi:AAA ATPase domain
VTESRDSAASNYDVEVTGGKGAVIGDYATVFQVFTQATSPLASLIRAREFEAVVEERTRKFVGRDFVFAAIDEALHTDEFPSGYIVVQGEPGIGKTALLAQLVKEHGYVHHFNIDPQGIRSSQAFLSNVCAQLVVRYELDHAALPAEATQDGGFMLRLLTEAVANGDNIPLVVVVDALDEAEDIGLASRANRLFLPPTLPAGVYFVVSTRELYDYRLFVDARRDIYLREDDPQNLKDIRAYIREFLRANPEKMAAKIEEWRVPEHEFVEALTANSEGNFMYLVHVLGDIRSGALTASSVDDIRKLPQGLRAYYRLHWNEMRSIDHERGSQGRSAPGRWRLSRRTSQNGVEGARYRTRSKRRPRCQHMSATKPPKTLRRPSGDGYGARHPSPRSPMCPSNGACPTGSRASGRRPRGSKVHPIPTIAHWRPGRSSNSGRTFLCPCSQRHSSRSARASRLWEVRAGESTSSRSLPSGS